MNGKLVLRNACLGVASGLLALTLTACGGQGASGAGQSGSAQGASGGTIERQAVSHAASSTSESTTSASSSASDQDYSGQVSIEREYTLEQRNRTLHVLVIKNNSDATLKVSSNSTAHDSEGGLIGAADASVSAVGPGCTSYLKEYYSDVKGVGKFESVISAKQDKAVSVIQDLDISATPAGNNVVLQCTNNGEREAQFVQALVLYFNGDTLVDSSEQYITSVSEQFNPGDTRSEQVSTRETFDSISVYLSGRG